MKVFVFGIAALALVAATGQAAPFDAKTISADAKWVVHVDFDAVRDSQIVKKSFQTCPALKSEAGKHFDKIVEQFGIDLRKDLHGVTLYGCDTDKDHAVAIVYAKVNRKPLVEKAQKAPDHKVVRSGGLEIHTWTDKTGPKSHPAAGAFYKSDAIVFASSTKGVEAAIAVLESKSPGLTDAKSLLGGHVYTGSTVLLRAIALPPNAHNPMAAQADAFRIAMGENKGKSFYRARVFMKTPEAAEQIKALTEGVKALGDLQFAGDSDIKKLVDGLKATTKGKVASVAWDASTDDVWTVVEKVANKVMDHMKTKGASEKKASTK
jgi:hypothetical protein